MLRSDVTRYQQLNLADALDKLRTIIRALEAATGKITSPETLEKHRRKYVLRIYMNQI